MTGTLLSNALAARDPHERRISRFLLWLACAGSMLGTVAALLANFHWVAELFTHFRLYFLIVQAALVLAFLNTRRPGWLALTCLLAVPNAWAVGPYLAPLLPRIVMAGPVDDRPELIALNLQYRNDDVAAVTAYLDARDPEVIVLAEFTPAWEQALDAPLARYPHRALRAQEGPFGIAVYSRRPLDEVVHFDLGAPGSNHLRVRIELHDRTVTVFAVHLFPPTSAERARMRNRQLVRLVEELAVTPGPRVVVGDLNTTPFSPYFRELLTATGLADARLPSGFHVTWPNLPLPLWIPIDHCLADAAAGVQDVRTGPGVGSDHYPLEIDFAAAI